MRSCIWSSNDRLYMTDYSEAKKQRSAWLQNCRRDRDFEAGDGDSGNARTKAMHYVVNTTIRDRRFFTTRAGRMGLGPPLAVKTLPPTPDEVFLFKGGKTPFILRPLGKRKIPGIGGEARSCYQMLGDCYLHGVMQGEAMEDFEERSEYIYII